MTEADVDAPATGTPAPDPLVPTRRGLGRVAVGLLAALATVGTKQKAADAAVWGCCSPAVPSRRCGSGRCPSGYYRRGWYCCDGATIWYCTECTRSTSSCWYGPFYCSDWAPTQGC